MRFRSLILIIITVLVSFSLIFTLPQLHHIRYFCLSSVAPLLLCSSFILYFDQKSTNSHHNTAIIIVTAISCILHICSFLNYPPDIGVDSRGYIYWATEFCKGNGFPGLWYRPPLYPYFMGIIFKLPHSTSLVPVIILQHLLLISCTPLLYILARLWTFPKPVAILASLLFAFNSLIMQMSRAIMSEALFIFLFIISLISLAGLFRNPSFYSGICCGIIFSIMAHCRQIASPILFLSLIPFCILKPKKHFYIGAVIIAVFIVSEIPWSIRNLKMFGSYELSSQLGANIFTKICSYNLEPKNGKTFEQIRPLYYQIRSNLQLTNEAPDIPENDWDINSIPHLVIDSLVAQGYSPALGSKLLVKASIEGFLQNPLDYLKSVWNALSTMLFYYREMYPDLEQSVPFMSDFYQVWIFRFLLRGIVSISGVFLLIFPLFLAFSRRKWNSPLFTPFYITLFGYISTSMIHVGFTRYTIPWMPFLILCASYISIGLISKISSIFKVKCDNRSKKDRELQSQ